MCCVRVAEVPDAKAATGRVKSASITVDAKANTLTVTAPPKKFALAKKLIEEIDSRPAITGRVRPSVRSGTARVSGSGRHG